MATAAPIIAKLPPSSIARIGGSTQFGCGNYPY
jgi:hypothetical protein